MMAHYVFEVPLFCFSGGQRGSPELFMRIPATLSNDPMQAPRTWDSRVNHVETAGYGRWR